MGDHDFGGEQPENYEQKCPCVLVLDTSSSMDGDPINDLNSGLEILFSETKTDAIASQRLEFAVITFDSEVRVAQSFRSVRHTELGKLEARRSTKLVDGVREGIKHIEARKAWYSENSQNYYRPYLVLITDGYPDDDQDIAGLEAELRAGVNDKHFIFWAFGVSGADMEMLGKLSGEAVPKFIKDADFKNFFLWLSRSMAAISKSKKGDKVDLSPENILPEKTDIFQHTVS